MSEINREVQALDGDALVSLFILDTTPLGGTDIYRFTTKPDVGDAPVVFDGHDYTPIDIEATGFKWDGKGSFPKPKLRIANVSGLITAIINTYGDVVGSRFIRLRTFAKFLDNGANPDPTAQFPAEIYNVEQRTRQNNVFVEWQLSSVLDQMGAKIPRRQCIRGTCTHTYRLWDPDTETFDYSNASCPYVAAPTYDESGNLVASPLDKCGKKLSDCKLRFGANGKLPTRAFPGIARVRQ